MSAKFLKGIDTNAQRITSVADPTAGTDAANKQYVDALVVGLSWKNEVRVATTTTGTLATSFENGDTVDGVTLVTGDRILIKDQSSGQENGIYVVAASGAPTRATDADSTAELENATVFVMAGSTNADKAFTQTATITTPGTTVQTWVQFGGGQTYTAGDGLTLTTNDFAVGAGTGITVNANDVAVNTSVVVRKYAGNCAATTNPQTFAHGLGTADLVVSVYESGVQVYPDVSVDSTNVTVDWGSAPSSAQYRVVAHA